MIVVLLSLPVALAQLTMQSNPPLNNQELRITGQAAEASARIDLTLSQPDGSQEIITVFADEAGAWVTNLSIEQEGSYTLLARSGEQEASLSWEATADNTLTLAEGETAPLVIASAQAEVTLTNTPSEEANETDEASEADESSDDAAETVPEETASEETAEETSAELTTSEATVEDGREDGGESSTDSQSTEDSDTAAITDDTASNETGAPALEDTAVNEDTSAESAPGESTVNLAQTTAQDSVADTQDSDTEDESDTTGDDISETNALTGTPETDTPETGPIDVCATLPTEQLTGFQTIIEGRELTACRDAEQLWQLGFSTVNANNLQVLDIETSLYAAIGNSVLQLEHETGRVLDRWLVANRVSQLSMSDEGLTVTVSLEDGITQDFQIVDGFLQQIVRFSPDPAIFSWLEQEARVADPETRLALDETNPWLYLEVGKAKLADDGMAALALFEEAVKAGRSFYDLAGIAQELEARGYEQLAKESFDAALSDFERRGYAPDLLKSATLEAAYNFPGEPLQAALDNRDVATATFWAERLYEAAPYVEGAQDQYRSYANLLEQNGQDGSLWKLRSEREERSTVTNVLERLMISIGRIGWPAALAMVVAILCLHLTLLFKYWIPQSTVIKDRIAKRGKINLLSRLHLFAPRYYTMTEHLVFFLMFAATLALVGLADWHDRGQLDSLSIRSGTLASAQAQEDLNTLPLQGDRASFIRGYAAQIRGDNLEAERLYQDADAYAPAINNLAILRGGDKTLLNQAATLSAGGLEEVNYNLSLTTGNFEQGQGLLVEPSPQDFQIAAAGTWEKGLSATFVNPWSNLRDARPPGFSKTRLGTILWTSVHVIFIIAVSLTVLWFFLPRPRAARNAPRHWLYQVLSVLIPGSGLADEVWGFLLLIPWAVISLSTLSHLFGWNYTLGFGLRTDYIVLAILYTVNLVAFILEFNAYRRDMRLQRSS